jgi:hypothetical protein
VGRRLERVLILPPGHAQAIRTPRTITRREKWIIGSVLGSVAALAIVVVIALVSTGAKSTRSCIHVTAPSFIGAEQVSGCGATARAICRSASEPGKYNQAFGQAVVAECRKVGLPVGS